MSATLGGLIKDYRLQKNIQQLEIAYKIGWKDATVLSRIEQGVTKNPSRELVDKICDAMNLNESDRNYLLFAGGYIPTEEEIITIRERVHPLISSSKYPINVADFAWRLLDENDPAKLIHYDSIENEKALYRKNLSTLEFTFDEKYSPSKLLLNTTDQDEFLISIIQQFLFENRHRTNQKWYSDTLRRLMSIPKFKTLYKDAIKLPNDSVILDFATQKVTHRDHPNKILTFNLFNVPLFFDRRIYLEYLIPADMETFLFYEENK